MNGKENKSVALKTAKEVTIYIVLCRPRRSISSRLVTPVVAVSSCLFKVLASMTSGDVV